MELIELITISLLASFTGLLSVIFIYIYISRLRITQEIITYSIDFLINTEENQKLVYSLGGLFAQGVKGGISLDVPARARPGKFKWQDIVMDLASQFIAQTLKNPPSPSSTPSPTPSQDILIQKNRDKW